MPAYESHPVSVAYEQTDTILTKESAKNDTPLIPLNTTGLVSDAPTPSTAIVSSPRLSSPITSISLFLNNGPHSHDTNLSSNSMRKAIQSEDIACYTSRSSDSKDSNLQINPVDIAVLGNSITGMITAIALYEKNNTNVHLFITNDIHEDIEINIRILDALYCINPDIYVKVLDAIGIQDSLAVKDHMVPSARVQKILIQYIENTYGGICLHSHGHLLHIHPEACDKDDVEEEGTDVPIGFSSKGECDSNYNKANKPDFKSRISVNKDINMYFEEGAECKAKLVVLTDRANLHTLQLLSSPKDPNPLLCLELYGILRLIPSTFKGRSGAYILKSDIVEAAMTIKNEVIHWSINQASCRAGFDFEGSFALPKSRKDHALILMHELEKKVETLDIWFVKSMKKVLQLTVDIDVHYQFFENPIKQSWRYFEDQTVLLGEAAHQTSRSINCGLALAIEDAIQLGYCLVENDCRPTALQRYESIRRDYEFRSQNYKSGHHKREAILIHIPTALNNKAIFVPTREVHSKCKSELLDQAENEAEYM